MRDVRRGRWKAMSYHEVDFMVLGEASQQKRRKINPMGFREADFNKLGKRTHNILWETANKKKTYRQLVVPQRNNAKGGSADAE